MRSRARRWSAAPMRRRSARCGSIGTRLYLDRYWREERRLAAALLARNRMRADIGDLADARRGDPRGCSRPTQFAEQRTAAAVALLRDLTVIAGGPGTGKTTTVARIVALTAGARCERGSQPPLIALCAPTGKAAARLQEAVGGSVARLDDPPAARLAARRALPPRRQQPPAP